MKHNLIPPFLIKETGLAVDDLPKVQSKHLTKYHHSMHFLDEYFQMPLSLCGIFSCFPFKKPLVSVLNDYDNVFLTTSNINLNSKIYSENEQATLGHRVM